MCGVPNRDDAPNPILDLDEMMKPMGLCHRHVGTLRPSHLIRSPSSSSRASLVQPRSAVAKTASSSASLERLRQWVAQSDAAGKVDVIASPSPAGGTPLLVAAKDYGVGETVMQVPEAQWLAAEAVRSHPALGKALAPLTAEPWLQVSPFPCTGEGSAATYGDYMGGLGGCMG